MVWCSRAVVQSCMRVVEIVTTPTPRAAQGAYFEEGLFVSAAADFGLMPSLYEPSGLVGEEFLSAGNPVAMVVREYSSISTIVGWTLLTLE